MNNKLTLLASLAVVALTAPAFADSTDSVKATSTNAAGTTTSVDQKVSVDKKADGSADTTIKTDVSKDPKGLMNKSEVKTKETVSTDKAGNVIKDKKVTSGKIVEESATK